MWNDRGVTLVSSPISRKSSAHDAQCFSASARSCRIRSRFKCAGSGRSGWIVVLQRVARSCALFLPATTVPINVLSWFAALVRHPVARSDRLPSASGYWHRREVDCDRPALETQCNLKCEFKQEQSEVFANIYAAFRS